MSEIFNEKDLVTMNDKLLDLKYERKLERFGRKLKKVAILKDILRIITIAVADSAPVVTAITSLIFSISSAISGVLNIWTIVIMIFSLLFAVPYYTLLEFIDQYIPTEDGDNFFTHPHFDYLFEHIKDLGKSNKEIKKINRKIKIVRSTCNDIVLSKEEEERLKISTKEELMKYINVGNDYKEKEKIDDYAGPNYLQDSKRKSKTDSLNYLRKKLLEFKKIEKEEELESEKVYIKKRI